MKATKTTDVVHFPNGKVCRSPITIHGKLFSANFIHAKQEDDTFSEFRMLAYSQAYEQGQVKGGAMMSKITRVSACYLENEDREVVSRGYSFLDDQDQFRKRKGQDASRGKAVQNLVNPQIKA